MATQKPTIRSAKTLARYILNNMTAKDMLILIQTGKLPLARVLAILKNVNFKELPLPVFVEVEPPELE